MVRPPRVRPGDRVAVVAPGGPVPRERFADGVARLGERYRLVHGEELFARDGYLAGSDAQRQAALDAALQQEDVRAVLCARGGYGTMRLLPSLPTALASGAPRLIVGFSDITALHAACLRAGLVSLHGPVLTQLGALSPAHAEELFAWLESPEPKPPWSGLESIAPGRARGRAVGGNLELVAALCGTPWALPWAGSVLFLEEVGERPYRIDRSLTQLELAGARDLAGVVVGDLTRCFEPDDSGPAVIDLVIERVRRWGVPAVWGAPFGHGERNRCFPHGAQVELDADRGELRFLEGAVA